MEISPFEKKQMSPDASDGSASEKNEGKEVLSSEEKVRELIGLSDQASLDVLAIDYEVIKEKSGEEEASEIYDISDFKNLGRREKDRKFPVLNREAAREYVKALENNEKIDFPKMIIMYRDNDLYDSRIPSVIEKLKSDGREVFVKTFPREMSEEEIKKTFDEGVENPFVGSEYEILSDDTVKRNSENFDRGDEDIIPYRLDDLFNNATQELVGAKKEYDNSREVIDDLDGLDNLFSKIAEKVGVPKEVYVSRKSIRDHSFTFNRPMLGRYDWNGIVEDQEILKESSNVRDQEILKAYEESRKRYKKLGIDNFEEFIKKHRNFMIASGDETIPQLIKKNLSKFVDIDSIYVVDDINDAPEGDDIALVYDRHNRTDSKNKFQVIIPPESGANYAVENDLIECDGDFDEILSKTIDSKINLNYFIKKVKKENS